MRTGDSIPPRKSSPPVRHDGWSAERQLTFLQTLARTRSVTRAAAAAGMSRESAYRLRARPAGALFAAAWDKTLAQRSQIRRPAAQPVRLRHPGKPGNPPNAKVMKVTRKVMTPGLRGWSVRVT